MKYSKILLYMFCFLCYFFVFILHAQSALIITSDSSSRFLALQDKAAAIGKIVIENAGDTPLNNVQLNMLGSHADITISNGNCVGTLYPGQICYFNIAYQPRFKPDEKDQVSDLYVTFLSTAMGTQVTTDAFTVDFQRVSHGSWFSLVSGFYPDAGAQVVSAQQGKMSVLYSSGAGYLMRSTDVVHWSLVGDLKEYTMDRPGLITLNKNDLYAVVSKSKSNYVAKYSGGKWKVLSSWLQNAKIKALLQPDENGDSDSPSAILVADNGNIYVGFDLFGQQCIGIILFDGHGWHWLGQNWAYGAVHQLKEWEGHLFAATDKGLVKLDGGRWIRLGQSLSISDMLQMPNGDLYAVQDTGVIKYSPKLARWLVYKGINPDDVARSELLSFDNRLYASIDDG